MKGFIEKILLTAIVLLVSVFGIAQTLKPPKIENPNAASLGIFGDIPVSLFTGTPDISIPVHNVSFGNMNVPITLRYHSSSVKPANHPGWVGSGWDLQTGGSISRQINNVLDEFYVDASWGNQTPAGATFYYPFPNQSPSVSPGAEYANGSNWNDPSQMSVIRSSNLNGGDREADIFSFNFSNYSGKFIYSGQTKGWEVISDDDIKVELNGFLDGNQVGQAIVDYGGQGTFPTTNEKSRVFSGFTLTVPDGTKYIFGGADAIEYYSQYGWAISETNTLSPSNYLLKRIIDIAGNEIVFEYERDYPNCSLSMTINNFSGSCNGVGGLLSGTSTSTWGGGPINADVLTGSIHWVMYLKQISTPVERVNFSRSAATCFRYTDNELRYIDAGFPQPQNNRFLSYLRDGNVNNLKWMQLDNIKVYKNNYSAGPPPVNHSKEYKFTYSTATNERLTLQSFEQKEKSSSVVGKYTFSYNYLWTLPTHNGNKVDHWGFYNSNSVVSANSSTLWTLRAPNANSSIGQLVKIQYPTGGYTEFYWENHDASQVVNYDRNSLSAFNQIAGGVRIKEIKNYEADQKLSGHKKYLYKTGYAGQQDPSALPSSGILNVVPQYTFLTGPRYGYSVPAGPPIYEVSITTFNPYGNFSHAGDGSHVGYNEVTELNLDGSYTRNFFTNYGVDLNGQSHFDQAPAGTIGWDPSQDIYIPYSFLDNERGKITGIFKYKADNSPVEKTTIQYRTDAGRFNEYIKMLHFNNGFLGNQSCPGPGLFFVAATKMFNYNYKPVSKTIQTYDDQGNFAQQTTSYTYNSKKLIKTETTQNSKGETIVVTNKYPDEYADAISLGMVAAHVISPVIEKSVTVNGVAKSLSKVDFYTPFTGKYLPEKIWTKNGSYPIEISEKINQYSTRGQVLEVQKPNGVKEAYIWGARGKYLMAKITGSDYNTAIALVNAQLLDDAGLYNHPYTSEDIRTELNKLRTGLPNAMVTTYTYEPLVGLTSITDPRGKNVYYEYDTFNRLVLIRDQDNNILKKICYNYAGQAEDCSSPCNPLIQDWQNTATPIRCQVGSGCTYTGYQEQEQVDMNSCSPTYTHTRWQQVAYNPGLCSGSAGINITYNVTSGSSFTGFTASYTTVGPPYDNYTFTIPTGSGSLGCIPSGKYNLTISKPPSGGFPPLLLFGTGCSYQSGTESVTFIVSVSLCHEISIDWDL